MSYICVTVERRPIGTPVGIPQGRRDGPEFFIGNAIGFEVVPLRAKKDLLA